ncbi:uncharacterized protein LTR77_010483 [Saxophila tyrrhenica]|uniref:Major facilitator superfamily (MFS) profile domain-containing protein n=1 Tax=Saxophila tyrrhenica TaxID=1690608 RepID=A0AAV9NW06_9PEZI|nr:hypothetical protein LTR77_010483 [Saxophila tyrrhenica]
MSKSGHDADVELRTSEDAAEFLEIDPLHGGDGDDAVGGVEAFAAEYHLTDELDVLWKAAILLQHGGGVDDDADVDGLAVADLAAWRRERSHKWHQPKMLYFVMFCCSLGAVEQGFGQTSMNGANLFVKEALHVDPAQLGLINCGLFLAQSLIGSWMAQPVNDRIGPRGAIFVATLLCFIGNASSALSGSWPVLLVARVVLGIGLGLNASTVAVLAGESAPASIRGGLGVSWQMFTAFGIFLGCLANALLNGHAADVVWRLQLAAPAIPTVPLLVLIFVCPESPSWYINRAHYGKAFAALTKLRNTKLQAACELYAHYVAKREQTKVSADGEHALWALIRCSDIADPIQESEPATFASKLASLLTVPRNRHAVYASYIVMITQQLCGINIIAFYSSTIFLSSGFPAAAALWASVVFGIVNFLGAFPAIWTMDAFGRRRLLLWTLPPMAVTMALASLTFGLSHGKAQLVLLAGLIYLFCALYSPGVGLVPVAYSAEVYPPTSARWA